MLFAFTDVAVGWSGSTIVVWQAKKLIKRDMNQKKDELNTEMRGKLRESEKAREKRLQEGEL